MRQRRLFLILLLTVLLASCASKESKEFRDDENVQKEIYETIIKKGEEDFNLKLVPNMDKLRFDFTDALPLIDDEQLIVPVETTNKPIFKFNAIIRIDAKNDGYRALDEIEIDSGGLSGLGEFLLTYIFMVENKSKFKAIIDYEEGVSLSSVNVLSKTSVYIEDEKKREELIHSMTADYNAGKFGEPEEHASLLSKFMLEDNNHNDEGYLPKLDVKVELTYSESSKGVKPEDKFEKVVSYVQKNERNLPNGDYVFSSPREGEDRLVEYITIRNLNEND